jgi:non-homologous end joining protein Ku
MARHTTACGPKSSMTLEQVMAGFYLNPACVASVFVELRYGSRANWKGFLRLSLVTCPVASYQATSDFGKNQLQSINRKTGHRIKYAKVDADTGEEVAHDDILKDYKVDTDSRIEVTKDELENISLESNRTAT